MSEHASPVAPVQNIVHTPGPWVVDYEGSIGHVKSVAKRPDYFTPTVARYDTGAVSIGAEEKQANARLIAAAPEMFAALRAIAQLDYKRAATNGAAYDAVFLATKIISKVV